MSTSQPTTPLSPADAARLWMGSRENPMVVTAVLALDGPLDEAVLRPLLLERLVVHDRFRARIDVPRFGLGRPRWCEDEAFSLDRHVARVTLPRGSNDADLARVVSDLASTVIDLRHPAWRLWLVDGAGAGSTLVMRIHHSLADGMALLGVLFGVSDEGAGPLPQPPTPPPAPATRAPRPGARDLLHGAAALARLLGQRPDASGLLAGPLGARKRLAWSRRFDLDAVRDAAHRAEAHVNDLTLAALTGALRRAINIRGDAPASPLHALVPVALPHAQGALGNQFTSVFVELPVHVAGRAERLRLVREASRRAREATGLSLGRTMVGVLGSLGGVAHHAGVQLLSRKASVVASNVPGPPVPLHVGGRAITSMLFAAPAPGAVPLSASVSSYAGSLRLTVACDEAVAPAPDTLVRLFEEELAALLPAAPVPAAPGGAS